MNDSQCERNIVVYTVADTFMGLSRGSAVAGRMGETLLGAPVLGSGEPASTAQMSGNTEYRRDSSSAACVRSASALASSVRASSACTVAAGRVYRQDGVRSEPI